MRWKQRAASRISEMGESLEYLRVNFRQLRDRVLEGEEAANAIDEMRDGEISGLNRDVEKAEAVLAGVRERIGNLEGDIETARFHNASRLEENMHLSARLIALEKHLGVEWKQSQEIPAGYVKTKGVK